VELKQKEILDRAAHVIMRYGIKSVTMDDLARELSISKKTLYAQFGESSLDWIRGLTFSIVFVGFKGI
jgi:hypothetical protein